MTDAVDREITTLDAALVSELIAVRPLKKPRGRCAHCGGNIVWLPELGWRHGHPSLRYWRVCCDCGMDVVLQQEPRFCPFCGGQRLVREHAPDPIRDDVDLAAAREQAGWEDV